MREWGCGCQCQGKRKIPFTASDREKRHGRDTLTPKGERKVR
jgi:hypothetical protein